MDITPMRLGETIIGDITFFPIYIKNRANDSWTRVFAYINLFMDSRTKTVIGEAKHSMEAIKQGIDTLEGIGQTGFKQI